MCVTQKIYGAVFALVAGLVCATAAIAEVSDTGKQAMIKAGQILFEHRCRSCHADDASLKSYGPSLVGVVGRKAGSVDGFTYSDTLKSSGLVWTVESLRAWMANNTGIMPGTRMRHVGITDTSEQDFILEYLRSISN